VSVVLSEHLPLLATAPDGIQKLRGLILELAVRGKLVPQAPDDEPASELLKRIAEERTLLAAEGKLKKSKAIPFLAEDERPFELPNGWRWIRLATIGNIFNGNSINSGEKEAKFRREDGVPYIATKDVGYGLTPLEYENGVRIPESESTFKIARKGAVLICAEGGSAGRKCGVTDRDIFFGNKLFANEALAGIPPRFILYLYLSPLFREQFSAAMTGIIGGVSIAKFVDIPIPLAPLAEQHRIVAKVDELMALCDLLEADQGDAEAAHAKLIETLLGALTQSTDTVDLAANWRRLAEHFDTLFTTEASLDALKQSILRLAVMGKLVPQDLSDEPASELLKQIAKRRSESLARGYPNPNEAASQARKQAKQCCPKNLGELPKGWSWATLMQCAELVVDCHNKTAPYCSSGITLLRTTNIRDGSLNLKEPKFVSMETYERWSARCKPESGDLLITREAPMGEVCIIPFGMTVCMGQRIMLIRLVRDTLVPKFLLYSLREPNLMERVQDKPVGATVEHLRVGGVETLLVPVPPLAEQHRIVAKVDELMALVDRLKADLAEARARQARLATTLIETALQAA
jgi:type I restriction enzyme, S subunit